VVGGLVVLLLVLVGLSLPLAQRSDDVATVVDGEQDTTTSAAPTTTTTTEPTSTTGTDAFVFLEELRLGDCFNESAFGSEDVVGEIRRVDCASPHDAEVFAVVTLPGEPGGPYPGDDAIFQMGEQRCLDEFASYVGIDYLDSMWEFGFFVPTGETWRKFDDRLILCYLADPGFDKIEGSKRGTST
jgi:hypothetical protein